jgi:hypothetical protein
MSVTEGIGETGIMAIVITGIIATIGTIVVAVVGTEGIVAGAAAAVGIAGPAAAVQTAGRAVEIGGPEGQVQVVIAGPEALGEAADKGDSKNKSKEITRK